MLQELLVNSLLLRGRDQIMVASGSSWGPTFQAKAIGEAAAGEYANSFSPNVAFYDVP